MHIRGIRRCISLAATTLAVYACAPRKRIILLLVVVFLVTVATIMSITDSRLSREKVMDLKLAEMQNEMEYLMSLYRARQEELINLQTQLKEELEKKLLRNDSQATLSPEANSLMKHMNLSGTRLAAALDTRPLLRAPFIYQLLPHHMDTRRSLYPGFHLKGSRNYFEYVFGIPTVRRDKENYLLITLENLLAGLKDKYENSTLIVICIGETDLEYVIHVARQVVNKFPKHVDSGLIEIISPSSEFYPDFSKDKPKLGDSARRYRWRTKQNLDALFLMAYGQSKGTYYLMLEDDIIAKANYMDSIRKFTAEVSVTNPDWVFIEYCTTGGIGKLFKSSVLMHFLIYMEIFYRSMPIDWLIEKYLEGLECGISYTQKECLKAKLRIRPKHSTSLFQHIGLYSSLKGKIHKIKEKKFADAKKFFPHTNPPVETAFTSIKVHGEWSLLDAYLGLSFFWGITPVKGDIAEFVFKEPTYIKSFLFRSGNVDHVSDRFRDTFVEAIPSKDQNASSIVGSFDEFGLAEGTIDKKIGPLQALRLRVNVDQKTWVILSEIWLTRYDDEITTTTLPEISNRTPKNQTVSKDNHVLTDTKIRRIGGI